MKSLPLDVKRIARLPCSNLELLKRLLEMCLPRRMTARLRYLIDYSLEFARWTGGPEEAEKGQSVVQFLNDDVGYHLASDLEGDVITTTEYEKLSGELNRLCHFVLGFEKS